MKRNPITLITGGVLLVLFAFMLFTFQVRQTEVAVVTTFGKYSRTIDQPGFRFRLPWPIEKVYKFDNRLQTFETKLDQSLMQDQIMLNTKVYVGWRIAEARIFLERFNGHVPTAERTLEPIVRNAKSEVIGEHVFSDLVSTNVQALRFEQIEQEMLRQIQDRAAGEYGVTFELLGIKQLGLPQGITTTVFERMRSERQRLAKKFQAEGDREATIIRAEADGQASEIMAEAQKRALQITGEAERTSQDYYAVFEQNPNLAIFLFQLKAMEESLKERSHLILDQQTPPFNLLREGVSETSSNSQR